MTIGRSRRVSTRVLSRPRYLARTYAAGMPTIRLKMVLTVAVKTDNFVEKRSSSDKMAAVMFPTPA
jgi:hypothetical protein